MVEDHPDVRDLLVLFLTQSGHWVESTGSTGTALEHLRTDGFDVLITDSWLPNACGWDFLGVLRARGDLPPHVISTGPVLSAEAERLSRTASCYAHLDQPFHFTEVAALLATF